MRRMCNHENSVVPLEIFCRNIVVGNFCLKCHKFWVRDDIDNIRQKWLKDSENNERRREGE